MERLLRHGHDGPAHSPIVEEAKRKGCENTTVDDMVDWANYSRRTSYFGSKEDALFVELPKRFKALSDELAHADRDGEAVKRARDRSQAHRLHTFS